VVGEGISVEHGLSLNIECRTELKFVDFRKTEFLTIAANPVIVRIPMVGLTYTSTLHTGWLINSSSRSTVLL